MEPGSLPAFSQELFQEGLVIPPDAPRRRALGIIAANSRNPDERRGDLRAQLAAHRLAERRAAELVARRGRGRVERRDGRAVRLLRARVRAALAALPDGRYEAEDVIEAVEGDLESAPP